jgi:hypothetical protein
LAPDRAARRATAGRAPGDGGSLFLRQPDLLPAVGQRPLPHAESQPARHGRGRLQGRKCEELEPFLAADLHDVLEALVGDEAGPGRLALEERVGGDRGAVNHDEAAAVSGDHRAVARVPAAGTAAAVETAQETGHPRADHAHRIGRPRRPLVHADRAAANEDEVREGAARVHTRDDGVLVHAISRAGFRAGRQGASPRLAAKSMHLTDQSDKKDLFFKAFLEMFFRDGTWHRSLDPRRLPARLDSLRASRRIHEGR